jgi:hypothetical protein
MKDIYNHADKRKHRFVSSLSAISCLTSLAGCDANRWSSYWPSYGVLPGGPALSDPPQLASLGPYHREPQETRRYQAWLRTCKNGWGMICDNLMFAATGSSAGS